MSECVYVCVRERERESVCVFVCAHACMHFNDTGNGHSCSKASKSAG